MSLRDWFEEKRKFGGLVGVFIEKATKGYVFGEREKKKNISNLILLKDYGFDVTIVRTYSTLDF